MPAYKDNATGKWYCKFYYEDYEGNSIQKKKMGFDLKREALEWERDFLENQQAQPDMSFDSFLEIYKKDKYPQLRQKTIITKDNRYKRVLSHFKDTALNKITPRDIVRWQNDLIKENLSSRYINEIQNEFSSVLNHAVKFYGLNENPIHKAGRPKVPNETEEDMRFLTFENFKRVYAQIDDLKAKASINLLYWTGIRKGELLALTLNKIDFKNKTVKINRSLQRIKGKDIVTATKTYESRVIKLPDTTIEVLKEYINTLYNPKPSDRLFEWEKRFIENGIKIGTERANKLIEEHNAASNDNIPLIERIHVHGLRHSHASYLINHNINIVLISKRLGHKNTSITLDTYSHFYPTVEDDMLSIMNSEHH